MAGKKAYIPPVFIAILSVALYGGIASKLNHIDDTDETYGYWEVLHYLLYGHGMQTWEYAPQYAIRTYAFVAPMYLAGELLKYFEVPKLAVFYALRMLLGLFTALAQSQYLGAIQSCYPENPFYMRFTMLFMLFAPGVVFSSTSFLPSAVAASCIMLSFARWLQQRFELSIFWGCVAVLATGWPFVGVLLFPVGLHMLATQKTWMALVRLILSGSAILVLIAGLAGAVDVFMYKKWTSPTLNILLYNAAGNGDTLYGTEPVAYYIRNLILNLGAAWPLAIAAPMLLLRPQPPQQASRAGEWSTRLTVLASAALWLGVLFARPHKEERFLYPVYPLLAFVAAQSLVTLLDMVGGIVSSVVGEEGDEDGDISIVALLYGGGGEAGNAEDKKKKKTIGETKRGRCVGAMAKHACVALSIVCIVALACSRLLSNVNNYGGYMQLWEALGQNLALDKAATGETGLVRVCTGSDWYFFPSHFFLPDNARLEFVYDRFHGQLPQYFGPATPPATPATGYGHANSQGMSAMPWDAWVGTWSPPLQPFNDMNREEDSRYVQLSDCEYVVAVVEDDVEQKRHGPMISAMSLSSPGGKEADSPTGGRNSFSFVFDRPVLDPARSPSPLARAYYIPTLSKRSNKYNKYTAFRIAGKK